MPTCFVVMGFNKKTDYATGRTLDLDKTYRSIIKPAVQAAGVTCLRADEIVHSGVIDVPMYEQLLDADLVVADISTMNPNALYELGVRHALRPFTTIVMGESRLADTKSYPFDLSHLMIRPYVHLGEVLDYEEVVRVQKELTDAITTILAAPKHDSPVYTHLPGLAQPQRVAAPAPPMAAAESEGANAPSHSVMLAAGETALQSGDFATAAACYGAAHKLKPNDAYLVQRVALATYKSKQPTAVDALKIARAYLEELDPEASNDPETLGLWGAVHKRLYELTDDDDALDAAVFAHEKGFFLKNDYYNGINLAFLLNLRARKGDPANAIADFVTAARVRARVAKICDALLDGLRTRGADKLKPTPTGKDVNDAMLDVVPDQSLFEQYYWVLATRAEALVGEDGHAAARAEAFSLAVADWMIDSTKAQVAKLEVLLADSPLKYLRAGV